MKKLGEIDEVTAKRCDKCDYMNSDVPISKKKPNCTGINLLECEIYTRTVNLNNRIRYIKGEISPIFVCGPGGYIDTFEE